uniref:SGNH hydrolase-type esterase domain-containing protein n=1 Tax=Gadus morhua TaxID=8049 RepID=A0A8C5BGS9_GADMO
MQLTRTLSAGTPLPILSLPPTPLSTIIPHGQKWSSEGERETRSGPHLLGETGEPLHSPHPLVSPTTLIVGDSITRTIHFFNATTRCFPGAKVSTILDKLPELINSLPSSIHRVIVHKGYNDMARRQTELTKRDFNVFSFLKRCGKSVFISGPLPTMSQRPERFSRLLNLNIWLQSTCKIHNFTFIDNFNLFWNRTSLYSTDGIHPNTLGSSVLAANIQHAVQSAPHNGPHS